MSEAAEQPTTTRRSLLCCGAAALAGGAALTVAGCSSSTTRTSSSAQDASTGSTTSKSPAAPVQVGPASDVPVGGGKIYRDQHIVVTQPTAGQYKAFSARCTHAGCIVGEVKDQLIECPCHGSRFNFADGSVADGPAPVPLPAYPVTVQNGNLMVTPS